MNRLYYLRISPLLFVLGFVLLFTVKGVGQTLTLGGGNQTLTITTGIAGGQLTSVINTNCTLTYTTPPQPKQNWRITVNSSCSGQRFNLSVLAISPTAGTAATEVILTNGPSPDFITNIPRNSRGATCTLQYTASATFAQGNSTELGNDIYTITYTLITP